MSARLALAGLAALVCFTNASAQPAPDVAARGVHVDPAPRGASVAERIVEIQRRVQAVASYPPSAAERGAEGQVLVAFAVGSDGHARDIHVEASSGALVLDRAAARAVREAAPLPYVTGRITVPVLFALREATSTLD